jgi:hypothetical protein
VPNGNQAAMIAATAMTTRGSREEAVHWQRSTQLP